MPGEIAALRRQVRILSAAVLAVAIVAVCAGWQAAKVATLQRVDLVDAGGKQVAALRSAEGGSLIFETPGGPRAALGIVDGRSTLQVAALQIIDDAGHVVARLESSGKGATLSIAGEAKSSASITSATGAPLFLLQNARSKTILAADKCGVIAGRSSASIGIVDGEAIVATTDQQGRPTWSSPRK